MASEEAFLACSWKGADKRLEGVAQPQAEQLSLLFDPTEAHRRRPPIALSLRPWGVGQRHVPPRVPLMTLLPVVYVRAHGPLLATIAMLPDKPAVDALVRVPLLGRRVPVSL